MTLKQKFGELLQKNTIAIVGVIIIVFSANNLILFFPNFTDSAIWGIPLALLIIWFITWVKGLGWSDLGFKQPDSWPRTILGGILIAIVLQSAALLQIKLGGPSPDISSFNQIKSALPPGFGPPIKLDQPSESELVASQPQLAPVACSPANYAV